MYNKKETLIYQSKFMTFCGRKISTKSKFKNKNKKCKQSYIKLSTKQIYYSNDELIINLTIISCCECCLVRPLGRDATKPA